jgi:hypothetical protein
MVLRKKGESESPKKSFTHVERKLAIATIHQSCHVSMVKVMILVVLDGPNRIKSLWNRPIVLNDISTKTSHAINIVMAQRLSSKTLSRMEIAIVKFNPRDALCMKQSAVFQWRQHTNAGSAFQRKIKGAVVHKGFCSFHTECLFSMGFPTSGNLMS